MLWLKIKQWLISTQEEEKLLSKFMNKGLLCLLQYYFVFGLVIET